MRVLGKGAALQMYNKLYKSKKKLKAFRVDNKLWQQLKKEAISKEITLSEYIRQILTRR